MPSVVGHPLRRLVHGLAGLRARARQWVAAMRARGARVAHEPATGEESPAEPRCLPFD